MEFEVICGLCGEGLRVDVEIKSNGHGGHIAVHQHVCSYETEFEAGSKAGMVAETYPEA